MIQILIDFMHNALDYNNFSIATTLYMITRGVISYFLGTTIARFNKKLLGVRTPFNFLLFVMLGSIFAVAIIDEKKFLGIVITVTFLVFLNGFITMLVFYSPWIEQLIKGKPIVLIRHGEIQWDAMKQNFITKEEVLNELYTQLHTEDVTLVEKAYLTNEGRINFITKHT